LVCSRGVPVKEAPKIAPADTKSSKKQLLAEDTDDLAPILRTPRRGDLNGIVERRVLRMLVPFRRPEFFYVYGNPAGTLHEAFRELERVINVKYQTSASNRIVVAPLPTSLDRLREKMTQAYGDIAASGISIREQNKQIFEFTIPAITGLKIVVLRHWRALKT
jgi:hypothetical protein